MSETEKIREAIRIMVRENRGNERTHQWASILFDLVVVVENQQREIDQLRARLAVSVALARKGSNG